MALYHHQPPWMLTFLLFSFCVASIWAYGGVFVTNTTLICSSCESNCEESLADEALIKDCRHGCRMFDKTVNTPFAPFDEIGSLLNCNQSCFGAYPNETLSRKSCFEGCTIAKTEYGNVYKHALLYLHEKQRNMGPWETFLDVMSSIVLPTTMGVDAGRFMEQVTTGDGKKKRFIVKALPPDKKCGDGSTRNDDSVSKEKMQPLEESLSQTFFVILILGSILMTGASCYCCLYCQMMSDEKLEQFLMMSDIVGQPPSYDQLIQKGFLTAPEVGDNQYPKVKQEKLRISCENLPNQKADFSVTVIGSTDGSNNVSNLHDSPKKV